MAFPSRRTSGNNDHPSILQNDFHPKTQNGAARRSNALGEPARGTAQAVRFVQQSAFNHEIRTSPSNPIPNQIWTGVVKQGRSDWAQTPGAR